MQSLIAKEKDVEGLSSYHRRALMADGPIARDCVLPCTAQAIVHILSDYSFYFVSLASRSKQSNRALAERKVW